jgi:hypothetical protein
MKKYSITFSGHGTETVFVGLDKETFDYWQNKEEQDEDFSLVDYLCNPEDYEDVPKEHNFLIDEDGEPLYWDDHEKIFYTIHSPDLESCYLIIEEIKEGESNEEIINEEFKTFIEKHEDSIDYQDCSIKHEDTPDYILQCDSYQKGSVFATTFEAEDFDPKLLKVVAEEAPNGLYYFSSVSYNDEELYNEDFFTRGKGMNADLFEK